MEKPTLVQASSVRPQKNNIFFIENFFYDLDNKLEEPFFQELVERENIFIHEGLGDSDIDEENLKHLGFLYKV